MLFTESSRDIPYEIVGAKVRSAIKSGDISTVQQGFLEWQQSASDDEKHNIDQHRRDCDERQFLIDAVRAGQTTVVSYFLSQGLEISPWLVHSYIRHHSPVNPDVFDVFLKHGWNINADDPGEGTALRVAICENQHPLITYLLTYGADPNLPCMVATERRNILKDYRVPNFPRRPLDWAGLCATVPTIQLLLSHGADLALCNALHAAAGSDLDDAGRIPVMEYLLQQGVDINALEYAADEAFTRQWGQERGFATPLHYAARQGMTERVKFLLARGARKDVKDCAGLGTPREWVMEQPEEGEEVHPVVNLL